MKMGAKWLIAVLVLIGTGAVVAAPENPPGARKFLTLEDAALAQAKLWQRTGVAKPIMSDDGKVLFPFGQYLPTLTCAPLRACDIELQPGEVVTGKPLAGDSVRWIVTRAESGAGDKKITHVVVKPTDSGLDTNVIITTDRRTYHLRLVSGSNEREYLNRVGFYYPADQVDEWAEDAAKQEKVAREKEKTVVAELPNLSVDQLDFSYRVDGGRTRFSPVRIFNDGTRVYIQMPEEMRASEAPILLLIGADDKPQIVNYRVKDAYYIVDKLFDKAVLMVGNDGSEKVSITWTKHRKSWWQ